MHQTVIDLAPTLSSYGAAVPTHQVHIAQGALAAAGDFMAQALPAGRWHLIADAHTWPLVGSQLADQLRAKHRPYTCHIFQEDHLRPEIKIAKRLSERLEGSSAAVAIGAGTVNDLVKMASFHADIPYACIATAPSMNGYTSAMAALLEEGVKTTRPCAAPIAVLADIDLLTAAPYRMIAAGFGDLISKPVSQADWLLSHYLLDTHYSPEAAQLIDQSAHLLEGVAERLPSRNPDAVGKLMGSLVLSGLSMAVAETSAPSSGGEHLISHYLDMTHYAWGCPADLHGCQVGVATLTAAALYEKLLALDLSKIDHTRRVSEHAPWYTYREVIRARFSSLTSAVLPFAQQGYPSTEELTERFYQLRVQWPLIAEALEKTLLPARHIGDQLKAAGGPTSFAQLGATPGRARCAILHSKDIRPRYTLLHLLNELGVLESWTTAVLREQNLLWPARSSCPKAEQ